MIEWYFMLMMVVATFIGGIGALFLKKGSSEANGNLLQQILNTKILIGFFFYGLASAISLVALKFVDVSIIYPMTSMSYIWVAIFSNKFLGERIGNIKITGILLIIVGAILLAA